MQVSKEFLEGNQSHVEPKNRHYTKYQKKDRKLEVYRLHFELGYSGRQISHLMKISRNTINSDIQHHYSKLAREFEKIEYNGYFQKMLNRLNDQRSRLITTLDKTKDINQKITIERILLEIDSKITNFILRCKDNYERNFDRVIDLLNDHYEKEKSEVRFYSRNEIIKLPKEKRDAITKILRGEK